MIIKNQPKLNLYFIVNFVLVSFAIISFLIPFVGINKIETINNNSVVLNLSDVAGYLRFLFNTNKINTALELFLHNFSLALIAYILSLISSGVLGIVPLCSAFYIAGVTIHSSFNLTTIVFVLLEILGMSCAVFCGANIYYKRTRLNIDLISVAVRSLFVILVLIVFYVIAALIESNMISKIWSAN